MPEKKKYLLLIAGSAAILLYVCTSEVYGRWEEVLIGWSELSEREATIRSPEELAERQLILTATKKILLAKATQGSGRFDQNQAGVFDYLSQNAKKRQFRYTSVEPIEVKTVGEMQDLGFKLSFSTDYVTLGKWLNVVESGAIPVKVTKLDVGTENIFSQKLKIDVQGRAYLFPKGSSR